MSRSVSVAFLLRYVHWALLIAALPAFVATHALFRVVVNRFSYPLDVEWMESGTLLHAYRLLHGLPIYTKPGSAFMPFPYPPLHAFVLASLGLVFGVGYPVGRFVSIAATVVATLLLAREVFRQFSGSAMPTAWALLSVGAIAVGFPVTGGWYDVIRADSFAACLCVCAGVLVSADAPSRNRFVLAGAVMTAELYTKQTCVFSIVWLLAYVFVRHGRRRGLLLALGVGAASGAVLAMLQWRTHGYYLYYTFDILRAHPIFWDRVASGLGRLFDFAPYLAATPIAALFLALFGRLSARSALWVGILLTTLPMALLPYAKDGGFENDFLPVVVVAGPASLCILSDLMGTRRAGGANEKMLELVFAAVCGLYLQSRLFDIAPHLVTDERRAAALWLNARVARLDGPALIPYSPFLAIKNGRAPVEEFHAMSWIDVALARQAWNPAPYFERSRAKYLLLAGDERSVVLKPFVNAGFVVTEQLPEAAATQTFVGFPIVLRYLLERKPAAPDERCPFDFEARDYAGWEAEGAAFRMGPTTGTPEGLSEVVGVHGQQIANSFVLPEGDGATGTLLSPPFRVDGARLALRVGGGSGDGTRVELCVDGNVVLKASGSATNLLRYVEWDLTSFEGQTARIRIVDADTGFFGHVLVDGVCWRT